MVSSLLTKTCPLSKVAPLRSWKVLIIIVAVAAVNFAVFHLALAPDTSATASTQPLEILVWWTNMNWAAFGKTHVPLPNYIGAPIIKPECASQCHFTYDKSKLTQVRAVLFDVSASGAELDFYRSPPPIPIKYPFQSWISFSYETPNYFPIQKTKYFVNNVDLNVSYNTKTSKVPITFFCPWGNYDIVNFTKIPKNEKTALILFLQWNCDIGGANYRTQYIKQLMKFIKIDSPGKCLRNMVLPPSSNEEKKKEVSHGERMIQKIEIAKKYKFLICFENNADETDYVTEKMLTGFLAGAIPIYMGPPNIDSWLPGNNSIINARDFSGPKELAEYIEKVDNDKQLYESYFEWRKKPTNPEFQKKLSQCFVFSDCRICNYLHENHKEITPHKPQKGIFSWIKNIFYGNFDKPFSLVLDGYSYGKIQHNQALTLMSEFTISMWIFINENEPHGQQLLSKCEYKKNENVPDAGWLLDLYQEPPKDRSQIAFFLRFCFSGFCWGSRRRLQSTLWTHISVQYDKNHITFFVNGEKENVRSPYGPMEFSSEPLTLGNQFRGMIDELSIWSKILSEKELLHVITNHLTGNEDGLQLYLPLDEGSGYVAWDKSPNKFSSVFHGSPKWKDATDGKRIFVKNDF